MTMNEARAALVVPAQFRNNNCVQDAQWRLREVLALASSGASSLRRGDDDEAPSYVAQRVANLRSWLA